MQKGLRDDEYALNTLVWRWIFLRMHLSGFASYGRWRWKASLTWQDASQSGLNCCVSEIKERRQGEVR